MLFQNQYTILKKANDLSVETLNADNRATVKDICDRLRGMTWNQYEIERIRKDLIDISARCELEGRTLQEEIGGDPDVFLLELAPDLPRGTPLDDVCIWYPRFFPVYDSLERAGGFDAKQPGPESGAGSDRTFSTDAMAVGMGVVPALRPENKNTVRFMAAGVVLRGDAGLFRSFLFLPACVRYTTVSRHHQLLGGMRLPTAVGHRLSVLAELPL